MANNISVSVSVDLGDMQAKRAILSEQLRLATADLRNFAKEANTSGMTAELQAGLQKAGAAVAGLKSQVLAVNTELKAASGASGGFGAAVKEASVSAQGLQQSMIGIGQALAAAFAVKQIGDLAKGMADAAEQTQHAAITFGLTTDQVQRLKAEAAGLGVPFDAFTTAMQRVDKALLTARESGGHVAVAFKTLGVDIHQPIDQATLLQRSIAGLATVQDVPTRIGLAMQLFGRNIENLGPLIGATKEQIAAIASATDRYGAVNADAQSKGLALAEAFNQQKIAMMGLGLTLTSELGPSLTRLVDDATGLIESFREWAAQGDNLKNTLTVVGAAAAYLAGVVGVAGLGAAVPALVGVLTGLGTLLIGTLGPALAVATGGMIKFDMAADANPIGALVLAVEALAAGLYFLTDGFNKTNAVTVLLVDTFKAMGDEGAQLLRTLGDIVAGLMDVSTAIQAANRGDLSGINKAVQDLAARWRDADAASKQYGVDASGVTTALDEEAAAADRAGAALAALGAQMRSATGTSTPGAPDTSTLPTGGGGKGRGGGRKAAGGKGGDATQQQMQAYTDELQHAEDMAVYLSGNANKDMLQDEIEFWQAKLNAASISSDLWYAIIEKRDPLLAKQQQDQTSEVKRQTEEQVSAILEASDKETAGLIKAADEQVKAHEKAAAEAQRAWDKSAGAITKDFAQGLLAMAEHTKSFGQVMRQVLQKLVTDWADGIAKTVSDWGYAMLKQVETKNAANAVMTASDQTAASTNLALTIRTNLAKIASDAKAAAASAYSWASSWGGPIAGAVAAAVAFAGTMAFASAKGGYDIPAGVSPITQLHPQEMVLPASIAQPLKANLASGGPWSGGGGGSTYHNTLNYTPPHPTQKSWKDQAWENAKDLEAIFARAVRRGSLKL